MKSIMNNFDRNTQNNFVFLTEMKLIPQLLASLIFLQKLMSCKLEE